MRRKAPTVRKTRISTPLGRCPRIVSSGNGFVPVCELDSAVAAARATQRSCQAKPRLRLAAHLLGLCCTLMGGKERRCPAIKRTGYPSPVKSPIDDTLYLETALCGIHETPLTINLFKPTRDISSTMETYQENLLSSGLRLREPWASIVARLLQSGDTRWTGETSPFYLLAHADSPGRARLTSIRV
jgi:hypothetical protein